MALELFTYPIAPKGLATSFPKSVLPIDYAAAYRNRYNLQTGGAAKRAGLDPTLAPLPGGLTPTSLHELVNVDTGSVTTLAGADGRLFKWDTTVSAWASAHDAGHRGNTFQAAQMVDRLVFCDGTVRPFYTTDGTTFTNLTAEITRGQLANVNATAAGMNFRDDTQNLSTLHTAAWDLVWDTTRDVYGFITAVSGHEVVTIPISGAATGDRYRILDTVELNVVPVANDDPDNVATLTAGSSTTEIVVSGMSTWWTAGVRTGDYLYNANRNTYRTVTGVSANLSHAAVAGQAAGDTVTLHKSACPIPSRVHVHFGRLFVVDARDQHQIRFSGPDDPTDWTSSSTVYDTRRFAFGAQQPLGDQILTMTSFMRFLVMSGRRTTLIFAGTDPELSATTGLAGDWAAVALLPQGVRSSESLVLVGNDAVLVTESGIQSLALSNDASLVGFTNISEQIKDTLAAAILGASESQIRAVHYPKRSLVLFQVGTQMWVYNYGEESSGLSANVAFSALTGGKRGSWSIFDGKLARQSVYLIRQDGTVLVGGEGGEFWTWDSANRFDDDGEAYSTEYTTGWLTLEEPNRTPRLKQLWYCQPVFDGSGATVYTVTVDAPFGRIASHDVALVTADAPAVIGSFVIGEATLGGTGIYAPKLALRARGSEFRLSFTTQDAVGPDVLSRFMLYGNRLGVR